MSKAKTYGRIDEAVEAAVKHLVSAHKRGVAYYVNLPLLYPDGSSVTLKIEQAAKGVIVSDGGFAFREVEAVGSEASFPKTVSGVAERRGVETNRRVIFTQSSTDELFRSMCDVAIASWEAVDRIYARLDENAEEEVEEHLRTRLEHVFGHEQVEEKHKLRGVSSSEWDVSAIVRTDHGKAVFQAVSDHPNSVYRTATAFHDLGSLEHPPRLISVVQSKPKLGAKLALLSQAGRVIEEVEPDDVFVRAAA